MAKKKDELEEVKKKAEKDKENLEKMEKARKDTKRKAEKKIEELNSPTNIPLSYRCYATYLLKTVCL